MQAVVDDTLVTYSDTGKGLPLVCVHGWMHDHNSYKKLASQLEDKVRIVALDLPNFGTSQSTDKITTIDDYSRFLESFVKKLDLKDYVLVGHSMGCQISLYGVGSDILHPKKLIMIAPAGVRNTHSVKKGVLKAGSVVFKKITPKKYKKKAYQIIGSDYDPDLSSTLKEVIKNTLSTDIQKQAMQVSLPTLFIAGENDSQVPLAWVEKLKSEVKDSELKVVEGEQHWLQQTSPEVVGGLIKDFIV